MKVFTRDYRINHYDSPLWGEYFGGMKSCVLDIEATGLDPSRCKVILMGLLTETESGLRVTQFLAENHYEEHKVLQATLDFLRDEGIDYIITFNGLRYDVPFINTRISNNFLENPDAQDDGPLYDNHFHIYDFDLYRFLRKCSSLPDRLDSLSQASVESYFGIAGDRQDTITGRESIAMFDEYALSGNSTIEKIILTHNREDVLQLYKLLLIAGRQDFAEILRPSDQAADSDMNPPAAAFHSAVAKYGFPVLNGRFTARTSLRKNVLCICGDQNFKPIAAAYFPDADCSVTANFSATTASYEILVPYKSHDGTGYVDLRGAGFGREEIRALESDPDCVNDYLILNSRTINLLASAILQRYL